MSPNDYVSYILKAPPDERVIMGQVLKNLILGQKLHPIDISEIRWLSYPSLSVTLSFLYSSRMYLHGHCPDNQKNLAFEYWDFIGNVTADLAET